MIANQRQVWKLDIFHYLSIEVEKTSFFSTGESETEEIRPVDKTYAQHIPAQVKLAQQRCISKEIQSKMSQEELKREYEVRKQQLEQIYQLMQEQGDDFGIESMEDMSKQMQYYMWWLHRRFVSRDLIPTDLLVLYTT